MTKGTQEIVAVLKKHPEATLGEVSKLLKRKVSGRSLGDARRELNGQPPPERVPVPQTAGPDPFAVLKAALAAGKNAIRTVEKIRRIVSA